MISDWQARIKYWVKTRLGAFSMAPIERTWRFGEECVELLQAMGMTKHEIHRLVNWVYDKPRGEVKQELGGVMTALYGLAESVEIDAEEATEAEINRIYGLPVDKLVKRQEENIAAGIGIIPPMPEI